MNFTEPSDRKLIERIRQFMEPPLDPPAQLEEIRKAELRLGFSLPDLLVDLYTKISNGGWGPMNGALGVPSASIELARKRCIRKAFERQWGYNEYFFNKEIRSGGSIPVLHEAMVQMQKNYRKQSLLEKAKETYRYAKEYCKIFNIVDAYLDLKNSKNYDGDWPDALVPIFYFGYHSFDCVNISRENLPVVWFHCDAADAYKLDDVLIEIAPSLEDYLNAWIEEIDIRTPAYNNSRLAQLTGDIW